MRQFTVITRGQALVSIGLKIANSFATVHFHRRNLYL